MSLPLGLMAPLIIASDAVQGEAFLPGQIFVFGGFALRANSLGHLEQIESYAPGHQVRFGSLNYTADIRGDLIFDGFKPLPSALHCPDEHDLALPPNSALEAAPMSAPTLNSELTRARPLGYCLAVELGHTHRDSAARPAVARIRRRSSLRGCRPCSSNFQI